MKDMRPGYKIEVKGVQDLDRFSDLFLYHLKNAGKSAGDRAVVVGLSGNLGAGKTTFSQLVAKRLGIDEVVTSPTFVIQKTYQTTDPDFTDFVHIDGYRLEGGEELLTLNFKATVNQGKRLVFIEWPEKVMSALPAGTYFLSFTFVDEDTRMIEYKESISTDFV